MNAHDLRFVNYNHFPNSSGKIKRTKLVNFRNYLPRDDRIFNAKITMSKFTGNDAIIRKRTISGNIDYNKRTSRNLSIAKKGVSDTEPLEANHLNKCYHSLGGVRRPLVVDMNKNYPRDDERVKLPVFMQKNLSRNAVSIPLQ